MINIIAVIKSVSCGICKTLGGCEDNTETEPIPALTYAAEVDIYEISSLLIDRFPDVPIYLPDMSYKTCTKQDLERFLAWDKTDKEKYEAESFDCDDFAWRLKGNITCKPWSSIPFGVVWTNLHALNCFVDEAGKFWFVEPQSNKIQAELESWQGTELRFIAM
jgi:hypothetical protein